MSSSCRDFFKKMENLGHVHSFSLEELRWLFVCMPVVVSIAQEKITQNTQPHAIDQSQVRTVDPKETLFPRCFIDSIWTLFSNSQMKKKHNIF